MLNANIISAIEDFAPTSFQESWDNTGIQVGSRRAECNGVLLCVDVTPAIVEEAHDRGCNLIISHHPLIFKGLKRLTGNTPVEESVMRAISYGITIYSCHTAMDSTPGGVSYKMAEMLGSKPLRVLAPLKDRRVRLHAVVGERYAEITKVTLFETLGKDFDCFIHDTTETTIGGQASTGNPFDGLTENNCIAIEAVISSSSAADVETKIAETAGDGLKSLTIEPIANTDPRIGLGVYALFDEPISAQALIERVKAVFHSPTARCTAMPPSGTKISRIAMCGGSGSEFIDTAMRAGAQAFITSDTRYHDFLEHQNEILIIDIGHFESESCTKEIFYDVIREKFPNFACYFSEIEENPIKYI